MCNANDSNEQGVHCAAVVMWKRRWWTKKNKTMLLSARIGKNYSREYFTTFFERSRTAQSVAIQHNWQLRIWFKDIFLAFQNPLNNLHQEGRWRALLRYILWEKNVGPYSAQCDCARPKWPPFKFAGAAGLRRKTLNTTPPKWDPKMNRSTTFQQGFWQGFIENLLMT